MVRRTICLISPEFLPIWSGVGSYVVGLVENLPNDIEIHLVTVRRKIVTSEGRLDVPNKILDRFGCNLKVHHVSEAHNTFLYH